MNWRPPKPIISGIAFLREYARAPRSMGSICPSSSALAHKMAEKIKLDDDGLVVELGAGTGCVTEALLAHGVRPGRIMVIERAQAFVDILNLKFPGLQIIRGDAAQLSRFIRNRPVSHIVSSLPFASLDFASAKKIIDEIKKVIGRGTLLQYTYLLGSDHILGRSGFSRTSASTVWFNLPPATVMEFVLHNTSF